MSSDNSYKGPLFVSDENEDDDDEYDVDDEASSINSDEDDDSSEFVEFVEDSMHLVSQISTPTSTTTIQFSFLAPLAPISFRFGSPKTEFACSVPILISSTKKKKKKKKILVFVNFLLPTDIQQVFLEEAYEYYILPL